MTNHALKADHSCPIDDRARRSRLARVEKTILWKALSLIALFMVPGGAFLVLGAYGALSRDS